MKKLLLFIPLLAISLTSCGVNYTSGKFFSDSLLKKEGIKDLPKPEGKLLREMSTYDKIVKTVYIQNNEQEYGKKYAQTVFDYLRSLSFKHFYSVTASDFLLNWRLSEREINSLEDCKYQENIHIYYFFCSNSEKYQSENDITYIDGIGVQVTATSGSIDNFKKSFKFDCAIKLCTNEAWNFSFDSEDNSTNEGV